MEDKIKASSTSPTFSTDHPAVIPVKEEYAVNPVKESQLEMEKGRMKEEIIACEILRRKELEAQVRMELMVEKQLLGFKNFTNGFSSSYLYPYLCSYGYFDDEKKLLSLGNKDDKFGERMKLITHPNNSGVGDFLQNNETNPLENNDMALGKWPFQRDPTCVVAGNSSIVESCLDQQVVQASPGTPGLKRKAEAMENTSDQEMASKESKDSQKKWYCSLCVVSTTSEGALNHHFQGKKHKANEANLRANDTTSSMSINGYSTESSQQLLDKEKSTGPNKWRCSLCQVSVSSEMHLRAHLHGKKHKAKEAKLGLEQNVSNLDCSSIEKSQENVQADDSEGVKTEASKKWYCPLCQVSALSEKNLNDHFQGKKHKAKSAEKVLELAELTDKSAGNDLGTDFTATKPGKCEEKQEATCNAAMGKIESERKSSSSLEETSDTKEVEFEQITGNEPETDTEKSGDSDQVNKDEMCDNLKYWHCQMCNERTCNEAAMAAHRKGNKHKTLLHKNGGGVIVVARVPKEAVV